MSQDRTEESTSADEGTEETRSFVRTVRRATRRVYTPEEKIRIVLEGFRRETTVNDLCRREGMNPANYYSWVLNSIQEGVHGGRQGAAGQGFRPGRHAP